MVRIIQGFFFIMISRLVATVEPLDGPVLPPRNVSLDWASDFEPQVSWDPPLPFPMNCSYEVTVKAQRTTYDLKQRPPWTYKNIILMEGGSLNMSVTTKCGCNDSKPVSVGITYPDLVTDLDCYIISSELTRCFWTPVPDAPESQFFYKLVEQFSDKKSKKQYSPHLQACPYVHSDGKRMSCDLEAAVYHIIYILFNGTLNNKIVRNTFSRRLRSNIRPLAIKWNVTKADNEFLITWSPPDLLDLVEWKFTITYKECNKEKWIKTRDLRGGLRWWNEHLARDVLANSGERLDITANTSAVIGRNPKCPYCLAIKAQEYVSKCETPPSKEKCFDADVNAFVYAAVIIPLMCAVLAVLTLVCCLRNKDVIFPEIPEPRDLISSILDNNNKEEFGNFCLQSEEEDMCKITLMDPPNDTMH